MGGASTQISFQVLVGICHCQPLSLSASAIFYPTQSHHVTPCFTYHGPVQVASAANLAAEDVFRMQLFGLNDVVYTHSYLCYGANEAFNAYYLGLLADGQSSAACLPTQASVSFTSAELMTLKASYCSKSIPFPTATSALINGLSDGLACMQAIAKFVANSPMGQGQPPLTNALDLFAFSGYYHVVDFMCSYLDPSRMCARALNSSAWQVSPKGLGQLGIVTCGLSLDELSTACNGTIKPSYLQVYCLQASYFYTVLTKGYGLADESTALHFVDEVNQQSMGKLVWINGLERVVLGQSIPAVDSS